MSISRTIAVRFCTAIFVLATMAPAGVLAQGPAANLSPKQREAATKLKEKIEKIAEKLAPIQQGVVSKDPKLQKAGMKLKSLIEAAMKKTGVNPQKAVARLQAIQSKAQGKSEAQQKKLRAEFEKIRQSLVIAEQKALTNKKVVAARDALRKKLEAAMIKSDPKAKKLLREFNKLTKKLKKLLGV